MSLAGELDARLAEIAGEPDETARAVAVHLAFTDLAAALSASLAGAVQAWTLVQFRPIEEVARSHGLAPQLAKASLVDALRVAADMIETDESSRGDAL